MEGLEQTLLLSRRSDGLERLEDLTEVTMRGLVVVLAIVLAPLTLHGAELPIFDAHVHYSHDAWQNLPPTDAVALLRKAGVKRALVSSSGDDGTRRLHTGGARPHRSGASSLP